jgi:hypothetical protein
VSSPEAPENRRFSPLTEIEQGGTDHAQHVGTPALRNKQIVALQRAHPGAALPPDRSLPQSCSTIGCRH